MIGAPKKITITLLFGLIGCLLRCMILFINLGTYWAGPQVFLGWTAYLGVSPLCSSCWRRPLLPWRRGQTVA